MKVTYANKRVEKYFTDYARLIIELNATEEPVRLCEEVEVEGVNDYHGGKENRYIN